MCANSVIEGLTFLKPLPKIRGKPPDFCRRVSLGGHFLALCYRILQTCDCQNSGKHAESTGKKFGVMRDSHLRLCVLDAVFLLQNKSRWDIFVAILLSPTASVPASNRPGSDLEILRSTSPKCGPVWGATRL